jgi:hypothetical protein|tara:strand:+ start:164 stop:550 length:387 start_codon:yes stop_codon:yes gene_type:complete
LGIGNQNSSSFQKHRARISNHLPRRIIRRFRGLGNHDEEFIERAHQAGIANEKRAANTKEFDKKAMYFALWDRLGENPIVQKEVEWWEDNRRKRKQGDRRNVASAANQHAKRQVKEEGRSAAAARHSL